MRWKSGPVALLAVSILAGCGGNHSGTGAATAIDSGQAEPAATNPAPSVSTPIAPSGSTVVTLSGSGLRGTADGTNTTAMFDHPIGVVVQNDGSALVADGAGTIRNVSSSGDVETLAGPSIPDPASRTGTAAVSPSGIAIARDGTIWFADRFGAVWRRSSDGAFVKAVGNQAGLSRIRPPVAIATTENAMVVSVGNRVVRVAPGGSLTTIAGDEVAGFQDAQDTSARFWRPAGLAPDGSGNIFVADQRNNRIRKIAPDGQVTSVAGSGAYGFHDGAAADAQFAYPSGLALAPDGAIYVADSGNNAIRRIDSAGRVTTVAGSGVPGFTDGDGAAARFNWPTGISVDRAGSVYVADTFNNRLRKLSPGARGYEVQSGRPTHPPAFLAVVATQGHYEMLFEDGFVTPVFDDGLPPEVGPNAFTAFTRTGQDQGDAHFQIYLDGPGSSRQVSHLKAQPVCPNVSSDGKTIYYGLLEAQGLFSLDVASGSSERINGETPATTCATLSESDGKLYFTQPLAGDGTHYQLVAVTPGTGITSVVKGGERLPYDGRSQPYALPSPSTSNQLLITVIQPSRVSILDTASGDLQPLSEVSSAGSSALLEALWSPSGDAVVFTLQGPNLATEVFEIDLATHFVRRVATIQAARDATLEAVSQR